MMMWNWLRRLTVLSGTVRTTDTTLITDTIMSTTELTPVDTDLLDGKVL